MNLTLTFAPLSGADDPNIQFSTGGRTATLTVKAGSTTSTASIGVQTGTVAGTITITSQLLAAGQNITPVPAPTKTIVIGPAAPSITSVTAATNSTGFTVTIDGFDPTRAVTQVVFTFTPVGGFNATDDFGNRIGNVAIQQLVSELGVHCIRQPVQLHHTVHGDRQRAVDRLGDGDAGESDGDFQRDDSQLVATCIRGLCSRRPLQNPPLSAMLYT